jgi:hypothetical protein
LPGRQHIDVAETSAFAAHMVLFDIERCGVHSRFRHVLVGTSLSDLWGRDVTGQYLEHTEPPGSFEAAYRELCAVVDETQPLYGLSALLLPDRPIARYEHLTLPLAGDGETVDMLLGVRCRLRG